MHGVMPAQKRVKKSGLGVAGKFRSVIPALPSVIPAKAGIHLSNWSKLLYGAPPARGRRCGPDFNRRANFFTRSFA